MSPRELQSKHLSPQKPQHPPSVCCPTLTARDATWPGALVEEGLRGVTVEQGQWLWRVKDWIDRGWMAKYGEKLPVMQPDAVSSPLAHAAGPEALAAVAAARMRCSGCGAKVGCWGSL